MVIYGWPILKSPIGKSIIIIFPPLREVNYEPELILNFPVKFNLFGFKARMVGVALNHESNGKVILFRSWNRIILHAGFERKIGPYT
jgi:outer membrane phospholipase A